MESSDPFRGDPFECGVLGHLHEAEFPHGSTGIRIESTFLPHDRLHKRGIYPIAAGGSDDEVVKPVLQSMLPDDDQEDINDDDRGEEDPSDRFQ